MSRNLLARVDYTKFKMKCNNDDNLCLEYLRSLHENKNWAKYILDMTDITTTEKKYIESLIKENPFPENKFFLFDDNNHLKGFIVLGGISKNSYTYNIEVKELNIKGKTIKKNETANLVYNTGVINGRVLVFDDNKMLELSYVDDSEIFDYIKSFVDIY